MGLLDKINRKATRGSVVRHAILVGFVGAMLYLALVVGVQPSRKHWPVEMTIWTFGCAFIGALWEWQVDVDSDAEEKA